MGAIAVVNNTYLSYNVTTGWEHFVYVFSTISYRSPWPRWQYTTWLVTDWAYWSVEAILAFVILSAILVGNIYFCFNDQNSALLNIGKKFPTLSEEPPPANDGTTTADEETAVRTVNEAERAAVDDSADPDVIVVQEATLWVAATSRIFQTLRTATQQDGDKSTEEEDVSEEPVEANKADTIPSVDTQPVPPTTRLYYLDNIKVSLIVLVFLQHASEGVVNSTTNSAGAPLIIFMTLNNAWFMQVFFFISAYFLPTSLKRKGVTWFLQDKLKRLGLPMLFLTLVLNPGTSFLLSPVMGQIYHYHIEYGVAWFLLWLLLFTFAHIGFYMMTGANKSNERASHIPLPSVRVQLVFGFLLALIQGAIVYAQGGNWFQLGFLGVKWSNCPAYMCFFAFGVLAKENDWLSTWTTQPNSVSVNLLWHTPVTLVSILGLVMLVLCQDEMSVLAQSFVWGLCSAMMNISFPFILVTAFEKYVNMTNKFTRFLNRAAYTTYLLHVQVLYIVGFGWTVVLNAFGYDVSDPNFEIPNRWLLVAGGTFVTVIGLPLTWSMCWCICRIPLFHNIL